MTEPVLAGKIILVSGGTQGVGAAVARAAARAGASVAVSGRRADVGERIVATLGADAAGLTSRGTLLDTTPELFDAHVAVNLRAPFFLMQAAVRDMLARHSPGTIVNIITMSAHGGQPYLAPYVAAKAGLAGLTRNAAHAHRFDRIRINGINLGWTDTPAEDAVQRAEHGAEHGWIERAGATLPMGRLAAPDDVAGLAVLLLSDRSGVVTGSVIDWDQQVPGAYD